MEKPSLKSAKLELCLCTKVLLQVSTTEELGPGEPDIRVA